MELFNYISMLSKKIVNDKMDFAEVEEEVFTMVKALGTLVLEAVLQEADERIYQSAARKGKSEGFRRQGINTLFGEIVYKRRLYRLHDKRSKSTKWYYPLDETLSLRDKQTISPSIEKTSAYLATEVSYRKSEEMLKQLGIQVSHETIRNHVQKYGKAIKQKQEPLNKDEASGERASEIIMVESDGIYISLQGKDRKKRKKHEIKVGCQYEGWEKADPAGSQYCLKNPHVLATVGSSDAFWDQVDRLLLTTYDLDQVPLMVFGSDGAPWAKEGLERYPQAIHQIDEYHFTKWIKRVFGFNSQAIVDTISSLIHADDKEGLNTFMTHCREEKKASKAKIEELRKMILRHWESLKDYRTRDVHLPDIARGVGNIENINDILVADRMKKRGMSWSIHGADHLIQVRASIQNGEWEDVCQWVLRQAEVVEKRSEKTKEIKKTKRGRRKTGQLREEQTVAWCQAHMPGAEGSEQWLRDFSKALQNTFIA